MRTQDDTASNLESVIESWRAKLLDLEAARAHEKPAPEKWSVSEIIGHLVDSACNNHQRFVRAQRCDELVLPNYEQDHWVAAAGYQSRDWESLVQLWYHYNRQLAAVIRNIPDSELSTPCTITPSKTCTLEFLVTDYLDHQNHHLRQVAKQIDAGS